MRRIKLIGRWRNRNSNITTALIYIYFSDIIFKLRENGTFISFIVLFLLEGSDTVIRMPFDLNRPYRRWLLIILPRFLNPNSLSRKNWIRNFWNFWICHSMTWGLKKLQFCIWDSPVQDHYSFPRNLQHSSIGKPCWLL